MWNNEESTKPSNLKGMCSYIIFHKPLLKMIVSCIHKLINKWHSTAYRVHVSMFEHSSTRDLGTIPFSVVLILSEVRSAVLSSDSHLRTQSSSCHVTHAAWQREVWCASHATWRRLWTSQVHACPKNLRDIYYTCTCPILNVTTCITC